MEENDDDDEESACVERLLDKKIEFEEIDIEEFIENQEEEEQIRRQGINPQDIGGAGDIEDEGTDLSSSESNVEDIIIDKDKMKKIKVIPVTTISEVLDHALDWNGNKHILKKIKSLKQN